MRDVGRHLLLYEEGVVARFALAGGAVPATDLQRLDLSIQVLEDLQAVTEAIADAIEAGTAPSADLILSGTRLERTRRRFADDPRAGDRGSPAVELF